MHHVHWWLFALSFVIGLGLTFALLSTGKSGAESESPTKKIPVAKEPPTTKIRVAKEATTTKIPVAKETPTENIPVVPYAPSAKGAYFTPWRNGSRKK